MDRYNAVYIKYNIISKRSILTRLHEVHIQIHAYISTIILQNTYIAIHNV